MEQLDLFQRALLDPRLGPNLPDRRPPSMGGRSVAAPDPPRYRPVVTPASAARRRAVPTDIGQYPRALRCVPLAEVRSAVQRSESHSLHDATVKRTRKAETTQPDRSSTAIFVEPVAHTMMAPI
jgi:hypothetical protein